MTYETNGLDRAAMQVSLHIRRWTARKTDKTASAKLVKDAGAKADVARVTKNLIDPEYVKKVTQVYNEATQYLVSRTLPWGDDGRRLLPAEQIIEFEHGLKELRERFWDAVYLLKNNYDEERRKAVESLGDLFNAQDYPMAEEIPAKFNFAWSYEPVVAGSDFRVELPEGMQNRIQQDIDHRVRAQLSTATKDLFRRVAGAMERMHDVLNADKPRIYDSLTGDLHELIDALPSLNLAKDPELDKLAATMRDKFYGLDRATLRENETVRSQAIEDSASVLKSLEDLL